MNPLVKQSLAVGRNLQHVHGLVERRVRIQVRAETRSDRFQVSNDLVPGERLGSVEQHVLDEMREPALVVVFVDRAGLHHQAELGALLGLLVLAHEDGDPVGERAPRNMGIEGERCVRVRGRRGSRGSCGADRQRDDGGDREPNEARSDTADVFRAGANPGDAGRAHR